MNTIEVANDPDRAKAPDGPALRVFVKEGNSYTLQLETADFQQAMKHAAKLYGKGQDILVNEKDKPHLVHAKSNLHKDVDVGREITPVEQKGVYVSGKAEILLESFYQKLPMDTRAYDARAEGKELGKDLAKHLPVDLAKGDRVKDSSAPGEPLKVGEPPDRQKVILQKDGFALPETILFTYKVQDGKYHDKDSNALRFEDHGKRLSTPVEDRTVIKDMIAVAAAKNWGQLELKGTDTFKQLAWLEAESRGIQTKGYKPNERDLEQLAQLKRERGAPEPVAAKEKDKLAIEPEKEPKVPNQLLAVTRVLSPDEQMRADVASRVLDKALQKYPEHMRKDILARVSQAMDKGDVKLPTPTVAERTVDKKQAPAPTMDRNR